MKRFPRMQFWSAFLTYSSKTCCKSPIFVQKLDFNKTFLNFYRVVYTLFLTFIEQCTPYFELLWNSVHPILNFYRIVYTLFHYEFSMKTGKTFVFDFLDKKWSFGTVWKIVSFCAVTMEFWRFVGELFEILA